MSPGKRKKLLRCRGQAVYHCWNRCVRRAFLCGRDPLTGRDLSHRRDWIIDRQQQLARLFAIEIEFHAEMSNHLHVVLRTRPDIARKWSREEVVRRWLTLTKLAKCMTDDLPQPDAQKYELLLSDKKQIRKIRRRLSSISWFMAILSENVARRANAEDECHGRFWESRYKCRELKGHHGILLCGIYVDLNPIKAGEASSPASAKYTSAYQRIQSRSQNSASQARPDGWMGELTWSASQTTHEPTRMSSRTGRRASDLGLLPISVDDYLKLLNWTARQLRGGASHTVPRDLAAILDQLRLKKEYWLDGVASYETEFCEVVGTPAELKQSAQRLGCHHLKGAKAGQRIFSHSTS